MKQVAGRLRMDMAAYREMAAFAQFGSELDKTTQVQLNRGQHQQEILKQKQYSPMPLEHQVIVLFAGGNGFTDNINLDKMEAWEAGLINFVDHANPDISKEIAEKKSLTDENRNRLVQAINSFNASWIG